MSEQTYTNLRWQMADKGVRILKVYGNYSEIVLPDNIEGMPVTEIGPYCFAASSRPIKGDSFLLNEENSTAAELTGNYVSKVTLPSTITTLHNAAFYNCRNLTTLSFGPNIASIGSDEFTNCRNLKHLYVRESATKPSGLKLMLERLECNLLVHFIESEEETCVLSFPEYYEWLDEVTPAHLFSRSINGEGYRMRKAFQGQTLDFKKYDACFKNALATESDLTLSEIAFWRLIYPVSLEESTKEVYEQTLLSLAEVIGKQKIKEKNSRDLTALLHNFTLSIEVLTSLLAQCQLVDWPEGSAILMEEKAKRNKKKTKTFDFDF